MSDPTGINSAAVTAWLSEQVPELAAPLTFELIAGGRSNLTFRVTDAAGRSWALRRPPTGHVLASAHDMGREHRIIAALQDTPVPVPDLIGLCEDETVNDAPFYVMEFVPGVIVRDLAATETVPIDVRRRMGEELVDTLVALHDVDPDACGLGELGRKEAYVERQLRRWMRQLDDGSDRHLPLLHELHGRLSARVPPQQGAGIVHGDYRLDNCMMSTDGPVAAVLDWELCTLGDVLADLGGMVMWWGQPTDAGPMADSPTTAAGFATADEAVARYGAQSSRDLSDLPYYVGFQNWRLACITEGVRTRYVVGAMGDQDLGPILEGFEDRIDALAEASVAALSELA
jgi:aminoglycoside phosphotransferase (APT) family kinase protein